MIIPKSDSSYIKHIFIQDSSSSVLAGLTALAHDTASLVAYYVKPGGTLTALTLETIATLGTYVAPTSAAHLRFKLVHDTNAPGLYEIQFHTDTLATNDAIVLMMHGAADMAPVLLEIQLSSVDLNNAVNLGLTSIPNAAADAAGGLPISDAGGLDMDAVLADTNELQTNQGNWLTATGFATETKQDIIDGIVDAIKAITDNLPDSGALTTIGTDTARLTAVRAAVLTDLIDGGRLDLLIDAILSDTGELQTNQGNWATATSVTVSDKTGFSLSSAGIKAIWDQATSALTTAGSVGKKLTDWTVGQVTSLSQAALALFLTQDTGETVGVAGSVAKVSQGEAGTLTAAAVADAVWDEAIADHTTSTTFGGKNQKAVPSETASDYKATGFAVSGDPMTLADDAITSDKFDESTAFPLKSADTGSTEVARTGADGDTLEDLSDEIAALTTGDAVEITVESDFVKVSS